MPRQWEAGVAMCTVDDCHAPTLGAEGCGVRREEPCQRLGVSWKCFGAARRAPVLEQIPDRAVTR